MLSDNKIYYAENGKFINLKKKWSGSSPVTKNSTMIKMSGSTFDLQVMTCWSKERSCTHQKITEVLNKTNDEIFIMLCSKFMRFRKLYNSC